MLEKNLKFLVIQLVFLLSVFSLYAQTINIRDFDKPGTYSYVVPEGITELVIECWGGGGGGSAAIGLKQDVHAAPGAGGGGGAHVHSVLKVTPGEVFILTVGSGGLGGVNPYTLGEGHGESGGNTFFSNEAGEQLLIAEGGKGASFARISQGGSKGGNGGDYARSKGEVIHPGGKGGDSGTNFSGGGGGAGGRTHEGFSASGMTAGGPGSCYCGIPGSGGTGRNTTGTGNPGLNTENTTRGVIYSSGGGGGGFDADYGTQKGGKGADGHIRIKEQQVMGDIIGTPYTEVGKTTQLIAPVSGGSWNSSLIDIATVDETGLVLGRQPGETVISYTVGNSLTGQSTEIHVRVYPEGQSIAISGLRDYCDEGPNNINLSASSEMTGDVTWYWTGPGNFLVGGEAFTRERLKSNAGSYTVTATQFTESNNLIINGNFENGNTGFTSNYSFDRDDQNAGEYNIEVKPKNWAFDGSCGDKTTGSGKYMSLLGNGNAGLVWEQTLTVEANTDYQFSYWMQAMQHKDIQISSDIELQVQIADENVGPAFSFKSSVNCEGWRQFVYNWNSKDNISVTIKISLNKNMTADYQVGLDDITFRKIAFISTATVDIDVESTFNPILHIISIPPIPIEEQENRFMASVVDVGSYPTYVWYVNDIEKYRGSNVLFTAFNLKEGDIVRCELTPDISCIVESESYFAVSPPVRKEADEKNYWYGLVSSKWYVMDNWTGIKVPRSNEDVEFATNAQSDLEVSEDVSIGNYINKSDKKLIVSPGASLIIGGQIDTDNQNKILIQASDSLSNGTLIFPNAEAPIATVEMYSKAFINNAAPNNDKYKWQYFGIPITGMKAIDFFSGSYVRRWNESGTDNSNSYYWEQLGAQDSMEPFIGYEVTREKKHTYSFEGQLVKEDYNRTFKRTPGATYEGQYVISNPYTAGIRISAMNFSESMQKVVYIFNTGSYNDWVNNESSLNTENFILPGQYLSIPQEQAGKAPGLLGSIPSMQGYVIKLAEDSLEGTLSFNYLDVADVNTSPSRSPNINTSRSEKTYTIVDLLTSLPEKKIVSDRLWFFTEPGSTKNFDNGWDGHKVFASTSAAQLFALGADGTAYQVNSTPDVHNAQIAFIPGQEENYTLRFTHSNIQSYYEKLYLLDVYTGIKTDITESGSEYNFTSLETTENQSRFHIITDNITGNFKENIEKEKDIFFYIRNEHISIVNNSDMAGEVIIYDFLGRTMYSGILNSNQSIILSTTHFFHAPYIIKVNMDDGEVITEKIIIN